RFPRFIQTKPLDSPLAIESQPRVTSPTPGRSTLITSAPRSARSRVHSGPASPFSQASTRVPVRSGTRVPYGLLHALYQADEVALGILEEPKGDRVHDLLLGHDCLATEALSLLESLVDVVHLALSADARPVRTLL